MCWPHRWCDLVTLLLLLLIFCRWALVPAQTRLPAFTFSSDAGFFFAGEEVGQAFFFFAGLSSS